MASNSRLSVLKQRSDFLHILKNGQKLRPSPWLLVNFIENSQGIMRCGWTLPRQVGPAIIRNRLKRWSRVYFRDRLKRGESIPPGLAEGIGIDINFVFRKADGEFYKKLSYERFADVVDKSWQQLERRLQKPVSKSRPGQ